MISKCNFIVNSIWFIIWGKIIMKLIKKSHLFKKYIVPNMIKKECISLWSLFIKISVYVLNNLQIRSSLVNKMTDMNLKTFWFYVFELLTDEIFFYSFINHAFIDMHLQRQKMLFWVSKVVINIFYFIFII